MATQWGRRETVVWQPHLPVYTYMAISTAFLCALLFLWESYAFQHLEIEKAYTTEYLRASLGAQFNQHGKYRVLMLGGGKRPARLALPADFVDGTTLLPNGSSVPVMLSPEVRAQGFEYFQRAPAKSYSDASMCRWLRGAIFDGKSLVGAYAWPLGESLLVLVVGLVLAAPRDLRRLKELKYGRRLKGPVMLEPRAFNRTVKGDGIGIQTADAKTILRIPRTNEPQHIEIIGDTGTGKSTLITQLLQQIKQRGESAIIYDPACEFVKRFYDPKTDTILNPLDARCPYWGPSEELRRKAEAKAIAASLYQPTSDKKGEFFTETPQKIFAHLLTFGPTPQQLVGWMSDPKEIDKRVAGTELASIIEPGAQQQRAGVLASLGLIADSLRMLPTKAQANGKTWSATEWAEKREGWIFITSKATEREALRPLHSLWIDLLVLRLLNAPTAAQRPVWFVLDELASLQRLPQLHTAITENRKSANPLILGFQGKAQLETIYGHVAEVMLSQPATKIFLRTTEPKAAKWVAEAIGDVEIERMRETHVHGTREGKSFTIDRQTEPLVMHSEIAGLPDKHAFLKLGNNVARFNFAYTEMASIAPDFEARAVEDDELTFDPLTLTPRKPEPTPPQETNVLANVPFRVDPEDAPIHSVQASTDQVPVKETQAAAGRTTKPARPHAKGKKKSGKSKEAAGKPETVLPGEQEEPEAEAELFTGSAVAESQQLPDAAETAPPELTVQSKPTLPPSLFVPLQPDTGHAEI